MKTEFTDEEREIRNGICDILCFLSGGDVTADQMSVIRRKIEEAVEVFAKNNVKEPEAA